MGVVEDTLDAIRSGDTLTDEILRDLARNLPPSYAITYTFAGEFGPDGLPLNAGVEFARTWVYDSSGGRTGITVGAITAGTADGLPIEGAVEVGVAYIGTGGVESLSGFSATVEGGYISGGGVTVPLRFADYAANAADVFTALSAGDTSAAIELLDSAPEGTIVFVSNGLQGGAGVEVALGISDGALSAYFTNPYQGPASFSGNQYQMALRYVEGWHGPASVTWTFRADGQEYTVTQQFETVSGTREGGVVVNIRTFIYGPDGERLSRSEVEEFGFSSRTERAVVKDGGFHPSCFLPGTPILLADGTTKPIEDIQPGDMVATYDAAGDLLAKPVTKTFTNDVTQILDVFGLKVTPGHVTLCGDGAFDGHHVPIIDIIRTDGALVRADGSKMRVTTGCDLGTAGDLMIDVICGQRGVDGSFEETDRGKLRAGTRMILENGADVSILDLIEAAEGTLTEDGVLLQDGKAVPFLWPQGRKLPRPEDYLLQRSKATLAGIYDAGEWEGMPPQVRHWM